MTAIEFDNELIGVKYLLSVPNNCLYIFEEYTKVRKDMWTVQIYRDSLDSKKGIPFSQNTRAGCKFDFIADQMLHIFRHFATVHIFHLVQM